MNIMCTTYYKKKISITRLCGIMFSKETQRKGVLVKAVFKYLHFICLLDFQLVFFLQINMYVFDVCLIFVSNNI